MNRYLVRTLAVTALMGPLLVGCSARNWKDPCWPERYNHQARKSVVDAFAPQVQNGHVLDQTVWNYMFNNGTDELNGYGRYKLDYMVRRRPAPDPHVFVQTAQDLTYDPADPDRLADARRELDQKRIATIQKYLNAQTVGRPMQFEFAIHDPFPVGASSAYAAGNRRVATSPTTTGVLGTSTGGGSMGFGQTGQVSPASGQGSNTGAGGASAPGGSSGQPQGNSGNQGAGSGTGSGPNSGNGPSPY